MNVHATTTPIIRSAAYAFRPPRRISVSEAAIDSLMIRQPGGYSGPWSPTEAPYMIEPMDMLASRRHETVCFVGPARTGKALDLETPIPTPTGWTTMGALQVGDSIIAPDGTPTAVVFATEVQHHRPCFAVEFSDGETIVADEDHRWGVEHFYWKQPTWRYEVRTTKELIGDLLYSQRDNGRVRYRYRVRNTVPLQLPAAVLTIDPYLLGAWLGDGSTLQSTISAHEDDAPFYEAKLQAAGHKTATSKDGENTVRIAIDLRDKLTTHCQRGHEFDQAGQASNGACSECLRIGHWRRKYGTDQHGDAPPPLTMFAHTFSSKLHALGVHGRKHIPLAYLRASCEQRLELLRGLMDTDGSIDRRAASAEFTTTLPELRDGFCELARTLGLRPRATEKATSWEYKGIRKTGVVFRVTFPVPEGLNVFALPRKAVLCTGAKVDVGFRQIVSITPVQSRPVRCIQVDNESHLFLAGAGMVPTHNTMGLLDAWFARNVTSDPGDMLIVQMSQEKAREYSKTRIDRAIRHSPALSALMSARGHDDNTHDKMFRHGMWVKIGWPSATQLSSSDYRYVALTDYDRMPDNIDGEGSAYALGLKRTQTFLSRGMCMVESSPGREYVDPHWKPQTPHEAPPATGVLGIYNRGDRRRWYWQCPDCCEYFEAAPGLSLFATLPKETELLELVRAANLSDMAEQHALVVCPHCGTMIEQKHKPHLNRIEAARWLADGQTVGSDGVVVGEAPRASIASYWLGGVAAAYQKWDSLILRYLQGLREYVLSGSDLTLKATINTDQGMPYLPRHLLADTESGVQDRLEDLARFHVPDAARFLTATVDVQGGAGSRFVVEVRAFGEGLESWLVDRFPILATERAGRQERVDPASYAEDWDLLTAKVVLATYKTSTGRELRVLRTAVDTGGEDGVSPQAYAWYRRLRKAGLSARVMLVKGGSHSDERPVFKGHGRTKEGRVMRDMPVWIVNPDYYKDIVAGSLRRKVPGPGYFHAPQWAPLAYFDELRSEVRGTNGKWKKVSDRARNEAIDLWVYALAICEALGCGAMGKFDWSAPPGWARPLDDQNTELITSEERRTEKAVQKRAAPIYNKTEGWSFDRRD